MKKSVKENIKLIIAIIIVVLVVIFLVRLLSGEDGWVCKDGKWEKHGNPRMPKPEKICDNTKSYWEQIVNPN
jgi:hypothetical protein